jgi:hypothetical protein
VAGNNIVINFPINSRMFIEPKWVMSSAWTGHIPFAGWLVDVLKPTALVELGTYTGTSYLAFCQAVRESNLDTRCYAVDTWEGDVHSGLYGESVYSQLSEYHDKNYLDFSRLMRATFDEGCACFEDNSIDLLHIDGLHTYEAVKHDFETWQPKLSSKSVVLFHDTNVHERNFGVWKYWSEISKLYPCFEFKHTYGLGVLLFGDDVPKPLLDVAKFSNEKVWEPIEQLFVILAKRINLHQKDESLAEATELLRQKDEYLATAAELLRQKDEHLATAAELLRQKDEHLATAAELLRQKDEHLATAAELIRQRDELLAEANAKLAVSIRLPCNKP